MKALVVIPVVLFIVAKLAYATLLNYNGDYYHSDYVRIAFFSFQYPVFIGIALYMISWAVTPIEKGFWWGVFTYFAAIFISHIVYLFCPAETSSILYDGKVVEKVTINAYRYLTSSEGWFFVSSIVVFVWVGIVNVIRFKNLLKHGT